MMDNESITKFLNIKEASKMLGVSPLTLRNWDKRGKLTAYRHPINNYRVYKLDELHEFLNGIKKFDNRPRKIDIKFLDDEDES